MVELARGVLLEPLAERAAREAEAAASSVGQEAMAGSVVAAVPVGAMVKAQAARRSPSLPW